MKIFAGIVFIVLWLSLLASCKDVTGPAATLFPETVIDTSLHIKIIEEGNLTIFTVDRYATTIVKIPAISSYIFAERPTRTLKQVAVDSNYSLIVNASFFDALYDDPVAHTGLHYLHAGYLKIRDSLREKMKDDKQLSRLFAYNSRTNVVQYMGLDELEKTKDCDLVVQTGPQIIAHNEVDTASINSSINGNRRSPRTTFASVNGKEFYIIVTRAVVTLGELGTMLRSTGIFKKDLSVIDFDGGPSTRIYIRNHPELSYNADAPWPVVLCVK